MALDRSNSWFRNYVRRLIDPKNTITGITYREEPAILAWELGNGLQNPSVAVRTHWWGGRLKWRRSSTYSTAIIWWLIAAKASTTRRIFTPT